MRIGAMNNPSLDPLAEIEWIGSHGFDYVDLAIEGPAADVGQLDPPAVRATLDRLGLGVLGHSAYFIPIGSPYHSVRLAALEEFRRALAVTAAVGAPAMTVHYASRVPPLCPDCDVVGWHVEVLAPLCREAKPLGIAILLENAPAGGNQLVNLTRVMTAVPELGLHLDIGHTIVEGGEGMLGKYLQALGSRLRHVHLSENDGSGDQHLPLGAGVVRRYDWPSAVRQLKRKGYDGTITLEVFSPSREYLLASRDLLRRWWEAA